jgi:hypothetical protein
MDETPEELERIRREAALIDPYRYRKRRRLMFGVLTGMFGAMVAWAALEMADRARNPCQRVRDHYCKAAAASVDCQSYEAILAESVENGSAQMRSLVRDQCVTKIRRLAEEDGVVVR